RGLPHCGIALAPCRATCIIKLPLCNNPITTITSTFNGSLQGILLSGPIASIMVESGLALLTLKAGPVKQKRVGSTAKMTPVSTKAAIPKNPHDSPTAETSTSASPSRPTSYQRLQQLLAERQSAESASRVITSVEGM
ncbi:hypothetical protein JG687_00011707, partial [Phytophthora cactorum]